MDRARLVDPDPEPELGLVLLDLQWSPSSLLYFLGSSTTTSHSHSRELLLFLLLLADRSSSRSRCDEEEATEVEVEEEAHKDVVDASRDSEVVVVGGGENGSGCTAGDEASFVGVVTAGDAMPAVELQHLLAQAPMVQPATS